MGKRRRGFPDAPQPKRQRSSQPHPKRNGNGTQQAAKKKKDGKHQQTQKGSKPIIPFERHDKILLIGEGDLSFAASLAAHHRCTNITATVYEKNHDELLAKYPHVDENLAIIESIGQRAKAPPEEEQESDENSAEEDEASEQDDDDSDRDDTDGTGCDKGPPKPNNNKVLYNVDATKPPSSLTRPANRHQHILFNFPHTGGKSTDVNRQVRYNQSLLVSFFTAALPCLAPGGSIVVTLFEGEPYTLWNIKDLGRHCGLAAERSYSFDAGWYPGYRHARTLGVLRKEGGKGPVSSGGWKGEERKAKSYVFRRKGEVPPQPIGKRHKKNDSVDSSDED